MIFSKGEFVKKSNNSEIDFTLFITLLKALTFKITVLVGYPSKKFIKFIFPFPIIIPLTTLALRANIPVLSSSAFGGWIIDESLARKILPIFEYTNLLAIVIGISKFLFNTDLISLLGEPVALKIFCSFMHHCYIFSNFKAILICKFIFVLTR